MEFSWQYTESMAGLMRPSAITNMPPNEADISFNRNETHLRWFSFKKIEEGVPFEVPMCITGMINFDTAVFHSDEIIIPIYKLSVERVVSGAETMLKVFSRQFFTLGLVKATTPKGEVYYGCRGLILDKDFNILLIATLQGVLKDNIIEYNKRLVHINPLVFTNDVAVLNKSLARKAIPFILSETIRISNRGDSNFRISEECYRNKISIVIDVVSNWIRTPNKPKDPLNTREELNRFINQNISDILTQIKNDFERNL